VVGDTGRWAFAGERATTLFAALVLSVDLVLGLIHVVVMVGWDAPDVLRVDMDGSYGEAYQYVKYFWLLILLVVYARQNRSWAMIAWVLLIAYFMLDDALLLHERAGFWYSSQSWAFGIGPVSAQSLGELTVSALVGVLLLVPLVVGYLRGDARTKWIFRVMLALVVVLLVFALVVDAVHGLFIDIKLIDRIVGFVEDFGEMLALSALVVFAFRINVSGGMPGFAADEKVADAGRRRQMA
jgi:hypothetical protein